MCQFLSHVQLFATPWTVAHQSSPSTRNSPNKNAGVGSHSLLQEIFPMQGAIVGLLHCRQILYCLSHRVYSVFKITLLDIIFIL